MTCIGSENMFGVAIVVMWLQWFLSTLCKLGTLISQERREDQSTREANFAERHLTLIRSRKIVIFDNNSLSFLLRANFLSWIAKE